MNEEDYIRDHIDPEPRVLASLYRHTHLTRLYPRMCTDHTQGRLLVMLTRMIRPHRILELGTFTGYSTLCFAEGMPENCTIDTVEIDDEYADELRSVFAENARAADIRLHIGDAEKLIPKLCSEGDKIDMVFVDANKRSYPEYYLLLKRFLKSGAYILADNTLWSDKVLNTEVHDPQTDAIRCFNDMVADDPEVEKVIIPVRDGLTVIRIK